MANGNGHGEWEKFGENGKRRIELLKTHTLKFLGYNPKGRTEKGAIAVLVEDVAQKGVLQLIHVDGDTREALDGNRRLSAANELGIPEIRGWVYYGLSKAEKRKLYADLNETARRFSGPEKLEAEYRGAGPVFGPTSRVFAWMKETFSDQELKDLILVHHVGPDIRCLSRRAGKYIGDASEEKQREIVLWMTKHNQYAALKRAIHKHVGINAERIIRAIDGDRPIHKKKKDDKVVKTPVR